MSFMFKPYRFTDPEALNRPVIPSGITAKAIIGNEAIAEKLVRETPEHSMITLDGYVGAAFDILCSRLADAAGERAIERIDVSQAYKSAAELEHMLAESLPEDRMIDPILLFGKSVHRAFESLFDSAKSAVLAEQLKAARQGRSLVILYGFGSAKFRRPEDIAVFMDVTPLEATLRIREHRVRNFGDHEKKAEPALYFPPHVLL